MAKGASNPTSNPEAETESCDICGKPGATVSYFATGMAAVVAQTQNPPRRLFPGSPGGRRIPRSRAPDEPSC